MLERVKGILLVPRKTLPLTLAESGSLGAVLVPHVVVLGAVAPLALFLSDGVLGAWHAPVEIFGARVPGGWTRAPLQSLALSLLVYAISLGSWLGLAEALRFSAPWFGGLRDRASARKAAAYMLTPVWLAGIGCLFESVPYFNWLPGVALIAGIAWAAFVGVIALPLHLGTPDSKAAAHSLTGLGVMSGVATGVYFLASKGLYSVWPS